MVTAPALGTHVMLTCEAIFFSLQTQELLACQKWPAGMFPEEEDGLEDGMHSDHHDRDSATTARSSMTELFNFKKGSKWTILIPEGRYETTGSETTLLDPAYIYAHVCTAELYGAHGGMPLMYCLCGCAAEFLRQDCLVAWRTKAIQKPNDGFSCFSRPAPLPARLTLLLLLPPASLPPARLTLLLLPPASLPPARLCRPLRYPASSQECPVEAPQQHTRF